MKSKSLLFVFFALATLQFQAQRTMNAKYVIQPRDYVNKPQAILPKNVERVPSGTNSLWVVYSNRDNNPTYSEPKAGAKVVSTLQFRQPYIVWDEEDDWVRICQYNSEAIDKSNRKITQELKDFGWIEKKKMLLWQRPMIDGATGFTMKCMAINKFSQFKKNLVEAAKDDKLDLYNEPKIGIRNGQDARLMTFLFIYGEEGDFYLIGKNDRISPITAEDGLLGWVHKELIQVWSQRMALEPNAEGWGLESRKQKDFPVSFFETEKEAIAFAKQGKKASGIIPLPYQDNYKPLKPGEYRFPILENAKDGNKIYKTGVISPVYNEAGKEVFDAQEQFVMLENYENLRTEKSNINIVFVVDGNPAMKDYIHTVNEAIAKVRNELEFENSDNAYNYEYGAIVYRNASEQACNNEVQKKSITGAESEILKFLAKELDRQPCGGKSEYSSLFKGLDAALGMIGQSKQKVETNVIVLIGGRGDEPELNNDIMPAIIKRMAESRVGFMAVKARDIETEPAYAEFVFQVGQIAREYQLEMRNLYKQFSGNKGSIQFRPTGSSSYDLELNFPEEAPMPCFVDFAEPGEPMNPDSLTKIIKKSIIETARNQQQIFAIGDSKMKGIGERREPNEAFLNYISQMDLPGYTPQQRIEAIQKLSNKNIQFFLEGYAPLNADGLDVDLFQFTVLLDESELVELMENFKEYAKQQTLDEHRAAIKEAYRSQLAALLGPKETKKALESMTMRELNTLLYGIPGSNKDKTLNVRLEELDDMDANGLDRIAEQFAKSLESLEEFRTTSNYFQSGSKRYYWVPQRCMP